MRQQAPPLKNGRLLRVTLSLPRGTARRVKFATLRATPKKARVKINASRPCFFLRGALALTHYVAKAPRRQNHAPKAPLRSGPPPLVGPRKRGPPRAALSRRRPQRALTAWVILLRVTKLCNLAKIHYRIM